MNGSNKMISVILVSVSLGRWEHKYLFTSQNGCEDKNIAICKAFRYKDDGGHINLQR